MNNNYLSVTIKTSAEMSDILMALMGEMPFNSFEEHSDGFSAYIKQSEYTQEVNNQLIELKTNFEFDYKIEEIEAQNWNEVWESNFHSIQVDDFCGLRADFHEPMQLVEHEIVINPKMAFGTGHHETTYMMIQTMRDLDFKDKKVFDYGCGTGILAILAGKLGATTIVGVDNEYPAYESTLENAALNNVPHVQSIFGTMKDVTDSGFDVILANINRNIIVNSFDALYQKLQVGGYILLSGFLKEDESYMKNALEQYNLQYLSHKERGNWICIKAIKNL